MVPGLALRPIKTQRHMTRPHPQITYSLGDSTKQRNVLCPKIFLLLQPDCPESRGLPLTSHLCSLCSPYSICSLPLQEPTHRQPTRQRPASAFPAAGIHRDPSPLLTPLATSPPIGCLRHIQDSETFTGSSGAAIVNPFCLKGASPSTCR